MTSEKLAAAIAREKKNLENYEAKMAELQEKAKRCRAKLHEYEVMQNSQKFGEVVNLVKENGISLEDMLAALQSGDLLALQERMEAVKQAEAASPAEETALGGEPDPLDAE